MKLFLEVLIVITSIVLTCSILFQSGNSAGLSGSIGGGAEQLFGKKKSKGYETILSRITTVCAVIFFICAIAATAITDGNTAPVQTDDAVSVQTEEAAGEGASQAEGAASESAAEGEAQAENAVTEGAAQAENAAAEGAAQAENAASEAVSEGAAQAENTAAGSSENTDNSESASR